MNWTKAKAKAAARKAIDATGGRQALATRLGVNPSLVSQWASGHRPVAAHHCIAIEAAAGGAVTRHDLRPDVFGPAPQPLDSAA